MDKEQDEWIENTLREAERRKCVGKVLSIEKQAAVGKGDNYCCDITRLKLRVQRKDGQVVDKSLILKSLPATELRNKFIKESGLCIVEVKIYRDVLPMLETIRQQYEQDEPLWGECYGVKGQDLLLEDLTVKGYKMGQRKTGLDFEHSSLVVRSLARFHALTAVLRQNGDLVVQDYDKFMMQKKSEMIDKFFGFAFSDISQAILGWGDEWKPYAEAIKNLREHLTEKLLAVYERDEDAFNVLNHGDCWVNNVLFKYDHSGRPIALRMIDFQASCYNSPGFDLQYFLHTSLDLETRSRTDELVQLYFHSLVSYLERFGFKGDLPSLEYIQASVRKAALHGLVSAVTILPLIMTKAENAPDIEKWMKEFEQTGALEYNLAKSQDQLYRENMKVILRSAEKNGLLQI